MGLDDSVPLHSSHTLPQAGAGFVSAPAKSRIATSRSPLSPLHPSRNRLVTRARKFT